MTFHFDESFEALTGSPPFPWQRALFERFLADRPDNIPASCDLPTGLGKTSVVAIWLLARIHQPRKMPRRLVYVVNRRTVVDQTTTEVERLRANLHKVAPSYPALAISTLRGQFADNREWSADPSRPAVIVGTVDMIGSRLLFSGYGVGFKARPLHAGFLGQDALLVHDEAHLEPAFQELLRAIEQEQDRERKERPNLPWPSLKVMELSATSRGNVPSFGLTAEDKQNPTVQARIAARKTIHLEAIKDAKKLAEQLAARALAFEDRRRAVLVFARTVDDVMRVRDKLPKGRVETLTGTMRGKERDELVEKSLFQRFMPGGQSDDLTTYLVCTSAGEVGVNISADHLVCDLSTFDSMAQRFGRVNRFGQRDDSEIHVLHPKDDDFGDDEYDQRRLKTLALLCELNGDGSPAALGRLDPEPRQAAFAPTPRLLLTTDVLFDAFALTSLRGKLPGRPPVEPYLHGLPTEWQTPETQIAWRDEVEKLDREPWAEMDNRTFSEFATGLLEAYPLQPREVLREPSFRAFKQFESLAKRLADKPTSVWLLDDSGKIERVTLANLVDKARKERIEGQTVLLPPSAGGLENGMLSGTAAAPKTGSLDVADAANERVRVLAKGGALGANQREQVNPLHLVQRVDFPASGNDKDAVGDAWLWFTRLNEGEKSAKRPVLWEVHVADVVNRTQEIVANLPLNDELKVAIVIAAKHHDHGKRRRLFQRVLGNSNPCVWLAKSGRRGTRVAETYRHEFGSLLDVLSEPDFLALPADRQELVLHLIATHHGRARPHFTQEEAFDPEHPACDAERIAAETPRRFAQLQRRYGRWGLAYLESLLRAADWAASAEPSQFAEGE